MLNKKTFLAIGLLVIIATASGAETMYERKFSLGGKAAGGNSNLYSLNADLFLNRNRRYIDELTVKGRFDREFNNGQQTLFNVFGSLRYATSINEQHYFFEKLEAQHDPFQNITLRLIPTIGTGYWFSTAPDLQLMTEVAVGYQRELLTNNNWDGSSLVTLSSELKAGAFSNELTFYLPATNANNYRLVNLAKLSLGINSLLSGRVNLKGEYNNAPPAGVKNSDWDFTVGLEYKVKESY